MNKKQTLGIVFLAAFCLGIYSFEGMEKPKAYGLDSNRDICLKTDLEMSMLLPPVDSNLIFPPSSSCSGCHGADPNGYAMVDIEGNDVSFSEDWESSMMANSAKDPYWLAKVSHEVMENPQHKELIESSCTSCHAPMGHYTAILRGAESYSMEELKEDTIGLDGVSCGACHMIAEEDLGVNLGGILNYDTNRVVYGPFDLPFAPPMQQFVGFEPIYSEHINQSEVCASCHTLIVETLDLDGVPTGNKFIEQSTYHEWVNSAYKEQGRSCQSCHLPELEESVVVSSNYLFLNARPGYSQHELVGGNSVMLKMMKAFKDTLGIEAKDENYDETISKTLTLLQANSLESAMEFVSSAADTAYFDLSLFNKAGHKFPSGFPSRRAFIEFLLFNDQGDTLFHSGKYNEAFELIGQDDTWEPHYDLINSEDQVQVYEFVPVDVAGNFTTFLEYGASCVKDNRLVPQGFSTLDEVYDTVAIVGAAFEDPNFNKGIEGQEGSGGDIIRFGIHMDGYVGSISARAKVHYQTLSPRWINPLFEDSSPEIDLFKHMYDQSDISTVVVAQEELTDIFYEGPSSIQVNPYLAEQVTVYPNPLVVGQQINIDLPKDLLLERLEAYSPSGKRIYLQSTDSPSVFFLGQEAGVVILRLYTSQGLIHKKLLMH